MSSVKRYEFTGELLVGPQHRYFVHFPYDVPTEFGTRKQVKVKIWIDGQLERKSLLPRGDGTHWVSISYGTRISLGKSEGDKVDVVIEPDLDPRTVELPDDLEWLLDNEPDLKELFLRQSYFNQKFFCDWIQQSSSPDTRVNRINRVLDWLNRHRHSKPIIAPNQELQD